MLEGGTVMGRRNRKKGKKKVEKQKDKKQSKRQNKKQKNEKDEKKKARGKLRKNGAKREKEERATPDTASEATPSEVEPETETLDEQIIGWDGSPVTLGQATRRDVEYRIRLLNFYSSVHGAVDLGDALLEWLMEVNRCSALEDLPESLRVAVLPVLEPVREAAEHITGAGYQGVHSDEVTDAQR